MSTEGFRATDITKSFAGVPALAGVSFVLRPGEVIGLVGHNGAGKSTLLKVLSGAHRHDGGTLLLDGQEVSFASPADALAKGVATVYQELSLLPNLTVTENVFLGRELSGPSGLRSAEMRRRTEELLRAFGLQVDPDTKLERLPVATRQLLEIAIATTKDTRYLLLDEPTTSLEGEQVDRLLDYIKDLVRSNGIGILLVDHKLDELYRVCDRIVALVDGKVCLDVDAREVPHEEVVAAIVGEEAARSTPESVTPLPRVAAAASSVRVRALSGPALNGVDLEARAGEVLGLYGLVGSGRTELMRTLLGVEPMTAGEITVDGTRYVPKGPAEAMRHGLVYLTEERKIDGIVPQMNGVRNAALPVLRRFTRGGWLSPRRLRRGVAPVLDQLHIRGNVDGPIVSLSGGNQQKVLLGRAIAQQPRVLMLDEPTKGVDIGVKSEIHRILKRMAHTDGVTLLVASSEEEEILEVSDRVVVFAGGRNVSEALPVEELSPQTLRRLAWQGD